MLLEGGTALDDVVKFPSRVRPLTEEEAREAIRRAGAVESITALAALLGWERTRAQRTLARSERDGVVVLKPGGPGGRTVIEYVRTPAHQPAGPDAHPTAHHTQVAAHPNVSPDAHPAQVDTQPDAHPARPIRWGPYRLMRTVTRTLRSVPPDGSGGLPATASWNGVR